MLNRVLSRGHTLIETMVGTALLVTLLAWALPSLAGFTVSAQVHAGAQALADTLRLARSEAVKRNGRVVVCKSGTGTHCQLETGWQQGWIVFHDVNNNGVLDGEEQVLHREHAMSPDLLLVGNTPVSRYVSYTAYGKTKLVSGAFQAGTFTVCVTSGGRTEARQVIINNAGRPRVAKAGQSSCGTSSNA